MIYIKSFYKAVDFLDTQPYGWAVSILSPTETRLSCRGRKHFVSRFDDAEVETLVGKNGETYFGPTITQIEDILNFTEAYDVLGGTGMVHCTAGKSRSTAVTMGILYNEGYTAEEALDAVIYARSLETDNPIVIPNRLVIKHFCDTFWNKDLSDVVNAHYEKLSETIPLELITRGRHTIGD